MRTLFGRKEYEKSFDLAVELLLHSEVPRVIRANCCSILGTSNDVRYLSFAAKALEMWEEILEAAETAHRMAGNNLPLSLYDELSVVREQCKHESCCQLEITLTRYHRQRRKVQRQSRPLHGWLLYSEYSNDSQNLRPPFTKHAGNKENHAEQCLVSKRDISCVYRPESRTSKDLHAN